MNQLLQLTSIHFKEFFRQPGIIFWAVFFPVLMAWGLGIAFTQKEAPTQKVAFISNDDGFESSSSKWNQLISSGVALDANIYEITTGSPELGYMKFQLHKTSDEEAIQMIKKGVAELIINVENEDLQFHFDPLNPEAQLSYLQIQSAMNDSQKNAASESIVALDQKGTRYIDFLVPGLLCMSVMMSCMWGISYGMIDKRSKKLLRRMVATPMSKTYFLTAQFIARLALSTLEAGILLLFSYFYFDISISGSVPAFLLVFLTGNIAFTGIAIFASSRTSDTRVGNGLVNLVVMPMMILSGIFFSYQNFPEWAIVVIEKLPLTLMADNIRSVFIESSGLSDVLIPSLGLTLMGAILFTIGLRIYKWY